MSWLIPQLIHLVWLIPVVCIGIYFVEKRRWTRIKTVYRQASVDHFVNRKITYFKAFLAVFLIAFLIVAASGPRWGFRWVESKSRGFDIMIAVDVSRSMDVRDIDPSRLDRARRIIRDLLYVTDGDRIGLIAFAGTSFVQCPLTSDYDAVRLFLDVLGTELIPIQGTDISGAVRLATKSLVTAGQGDAESKEGRFMLVISDGEDHSLNLNEAIEQAKDAGIKAFSVGMGTTGGGPIPNAEGGLKKDQDGNLVLSKLEEASLKSIASITGGRYWVATDRNFDARKLYEVEMRGLGSDRETRSSREKIWFERFQIFATIALILLVLDFLVTDVRRLAGLGFIAFSAFFVRVPDASAKDARKQFSDAANLIEKGQEKEAMPLFQDLTQSSDGEIRRRSLYNLGLLQAKQGDLKGAEGSWTEALSMDPQDQQVRENLAWLSKQSEKKENKDQNNKDQNSKDQNDKDQNNKDQNSKDQNDKDQNDKDQNDKDQNDKDQKENKSGSPDKKPDEKSDSTSDQGSESKTSPSPDPSQPNKDPKKGEDKEKSSSQGSDDKPKDEKQASQGKDQNPEVKKMSKEEAERLLRMIPDDLGKFYRPPSEVQNKKNKREQPKEDW
ncbi:MAG: VWA domain-containing protein [Proteobacteria bacterium]|nr:VWA domain-containing protein [Pseudomonadota bacterium]